MPNHFLTVLSCVGIVAALPGISVAQDKVEIRPVVIDYFFEYGCPDCERVKNQVLPELKTRFEGFYLIRDHDISAISNVPTLIAYQEKLNIVSNEPVCMVVDNRYGHNGFDAIKAGLFDCLNERVLFLPLKARSCSSRRYGRPLNKSTDHQARLAPP